MRESRGKAHRVGPGQEARVVEMNERDLTPGDVTIAVDYSTVNADMALAAATAIINLSIREARVAPLPLIA